MGQLLADIIDEQFYFCLYLTADEHDIVEEEIRVLTRYFGCKLIYYRCLKEGHVNCYREVKITGPAGKLKTIARAITDYLDESIVSNPHKGA